MSSQNHIKRRELGPHWFRIDQPEIPHGRTEPYLYLKLIKIAP